MKSRVFGTILTILGICAALFPIALVSFAYLRYGWEGVLWASLQLASMFDNALAITIIVAIIALSMAGGAHRKPQGYESPQKE